MYALLWCEGRAEAYAHAEKEERAGELIHLFLAVHLLASITPISSVVHPFFFLPSIKPLTFFSKASICGP